MQAFMSEIRPDGGSVCPSPEIANFFNGYSEGRRYTVHEIIGQGSYGIVAAATDKATGKKVAIKKIQKVFENVADATRILREIILLRQLKHTDVVDILHVLLPVDPTTYQDIFVVFELFESDLHTVIGANDDLTPDHHKVFLYQLLRGLNFIHQMGVLHRDLKPKNILANSNCKLKICDLGLARPVFPDDVKETPVCWTDYVATRWYRAPELCGCFYSRYSHAVDVWSLGCIFAEILLGKPLFPGSDAVSQLNIVTDLLGKPPDSLIERISNAKARAFLHNMPNKPGMPFESRFPGMDPQGLDLLKKMLSFDPADRPTCADALAHPYFAALPDATCQATTSLQQECFKFELAPSLTEMHVRELIFMEALHYHPHVRELCTSGPTHSHYMHLMSMLVEQYGPYLPASLMKPLPASRPVAEHHEMSPGVGPGHHKMLQQQMQAQMQMQAHAAQVEGGWDHTRTERVPMRAEQAEHTVKAALDRQ